MFSDNVLFYQCFTMFDCFLCTLQSGFLLLTNSGFYLATLQENPTNPYWTTAALSTFELRFDADQKPSLFLGEFPCNKKNLDPNPTYEAAWMSLHGLNDISQQRGHVKAPATNRCSNIAHE